METNRIKLQQFRKTFFPMGCFTGKQVRLWKPDFCRDNFSRWVDAGEILRLRQNLYTFPEYLDMPESALRFANAIYRSSYVSLHTALHFHGVIPEEVVQFTSVSTRKTASFQNAFGTYTYQHVTENYMFGYELKHSEGQTPFVVQMATPEKAILDLLHLYPIYNTVEDMKNLRLDEDFMEHELCMERLAEYEMRIRSNALSKRIRLLREAYALL